MTLPQGSCPERTIPRFDRVVCETQVSGAEFILEGLYAHKRIGRSEERVFTAGEKQPKKPEQRTFEREEPFRGRRPYN